GADGEIGADLQSTCRNLGPNARHSAIFFQQVGDLSLHLQVKSWIRSSLFSEKVQKVPLRHQPQEFAMRGQVGEVRERDGRAADLAGKLAHFLMRTFEELVQNAKL